MSILSSFKKALGFPDEYDEDFDSPDTDLPQYSEPADTTDHEPLSSAETAGEPEAAPEDSDLPGEVFDAVIELFNATQPEFVRNCLSIESQRSYLLERISQSLRDKLKSETEKARRLGEKRFDAERQKMADDLEKIKTEYHTLRQQREEFQSAQLSAARQKRALSERVHDLESQVSTLEAEKEQFQLENRSMLNKLRVANVRASADADTENELQKLAQDNVSLQDTVKDLTARNEALERKATELQKLIDEGGESEEQARAMAEIEAQLNKFEEIKKKKDARISELQTSGRNQQKNIEMLESRIEEAQKLNAELKSQIDEALKKESEGKAAADKLEAELKAEIKRLTEMVNATARKEESIPVRDKHRKRRSSDRRKEPAEPQVSTETQAEVADAPETPEASQTIKISAIDELMDSTDWFIAPDPVPLKKDPEVEEAFGYKEPVKKTSRDDDKQLSLW